MSSVHKGCMQNCLHDTVTGGPCSCLTAGRRTTGVCCADEVYSVFSVRGIGVHFDEGSFGSTMEDED